MAKLTIPDKYLPGVGQIRELDLDVIREIRKTLDTRTPVNNGAPAQPSQTAEAAVLQVSKDRDFSKFKDVAGAMTSMYFVKSSREISTEEFVEDVIDAFQLQSSPELHLAPEERAAFKERLTILLDADLFGIASKVHDLATEEERLYCHSRILTDLRPVFGPNVEDGPHSMLVMHRLKLCFHEGTRKGDKDFYVTLDTDDLKSLKRIIERAEAKAESLKHATQKRLFGV